MLFMLGWCGELGNHRDFFTVGVMGHASQIALGLALVQPARPAYCFDGDGVALIHTESMEIIGQSSAKNLIYMVFNNGIHGCVSVQPTVGFNIDITQIAVACCYATAQCVATVDDLKNAIDALINGVSITIQETESIGCSVKWKV